MSLIADDIESYVNEAGKVQRSAVYSKFDLVSKRAIDSALESLAQSRRLVVGASDIAPIRRVQSAKAQAPAPSPKVDRTFEREMRRHRQKAKEALGGATLRQAILAQFEPGRLVTADVIIAKLSSQWSAKSIRTEMSVMKSKRLLANRRCHGWWLPGTLAKKVLA